MTLLFSDVHVCVDVVKTHIVQVFKLVVFADQIFLTAQAAHLLIRGVIVGYTAELPLALYRDCSFSALLLFVVLPLVLKTDFRNFVQAFIQKAIIVIGVGWFLLEGSLLPWRSDFEVLFFTQLLDFLDTDIVHVDAVLVTLLVKYRHWEK